MTQCAPNILVCLAADPMRSGYTTGKMRSTGPLEYWQIRFLDGQTEYKPVRALKILQEDQEAIPDEFEILQSMKFTSFNRLRLDLTHHRLSGRLANLIYSLDATNTDFYSHQYKPVLAMINSPTKGILIGDEVGLGKTIEAGLIWTELRSRYQYSRVLIVCKAFLKPKWTSEFREKFGINLQQTNPIDLLGLLDKNKPRDGFALVASYDGLRPPKGWRADDISENQRARNAPAALLAKFLDEHEGEDLIDLVIFDECQYMRNETTSNHQIGRLVTRAAAHVVMLSATPVNNSTDDLFNLFNILDESLFPYRSQFPRLVEQNAPLVRLRDRLIQASEIKREEIVEELSSIVVLPLFENNEQLTYILKNLPSDEEIRKPEIRAAIAFDLDKVNLFGKVFTRTRKRDIDGKRPIRRAISIGVEMTPIESMIYETVTETIQEYADANDLATGFLFNMPQQQMCSSFAAAVYWWRNQNKDNGENDLAELVGGSLARELNEADEDQSKPLFNAICKSINNLGNLRDIENNDSKYNKLIKEVVDYRKENPGKKILLFSFFKQTLRYLKSRLEKDGLGVEILYGGMDKESALDNFKKNEKIDILVASEVAAEGVDLQFSSLIINYDLPWNPMRVEQRIGRIDRLGQAEPIIHIWNFYYKNSIDDRVYIRLYNKLGIFINALGGLEEIIGSRVDSLNRNFIRHRMTDAEIEEQFNAIDLAIENVRRLESELDESASRLVAHGDFIKQAINEAREFGRLIRVDDLITYVEDFFKNRYPGSTVHCIDPETNAFKVDLSVKAISDIQGYWEKERIFQPTCFANPALLPKTTFIFSNKIGRAAVGTELITQFHPINRFISSMLDDDPLANSRKTVVAAALDTDGRFPLGNYFFCCQRFGFSSGSQAIERLVFQGLDLNDMRMLGTEQSEALVGLAASKGRPHAKHQELNGDQLVEALSYVLDDLQKHFDVEKNKLQREINDRVSIQLKSLDTYRTIEQQKHKIRIQEANFKKNIRFARAQETKLKNLIATLDVKRESIEKSLELRGSPDFVAAGVLTVLS